jgi:hypothetical protein
MALMREDAKPRHWLQIRLTAVFVFVAALSIGFAAIKSDRAALALCGAFPFAVGLIAGTLAPSQTAAVLVAVLAPPFIVPVMWGAIWHLLAPDQTRPDISFVASVFGSLFLALGILLFGTIPAIAAALFGRFLKGEPFSLKS